ncbi:hypothetical protein, partial [Richelia intracellularis]|uniref:hypothetical protein n=1 Tax=Richelia intracellularis TaxID=1164990 RepID=UPI001E29C321
NSFLLAKFTLSKVFLTKINSYPNNLQPESTRIIDSGENTSSIYLIALPMIVTEKLSSSLFSTLYFLLEDK